MTRASRLILNGSLAGLAALAVLLANEGSSLLNSNAFVSQAQARIGRPLTPLSGAGVARRTTRRAVGYGAAAAAAAAGAAATGAVVAPACVRGPYGNVVCR